jgi:hypothetical protein
MPHLMPATGQCPAQLHLERMPCVVIDENFHLACIHPGIPIHRFHRWPQIIGFSIKRLDLTIYSSTCLAPSRQVF